MTHPRANMIEPPSPTQRQSTPRTPKPPRPLRARLRRAAFVAAAILTVVAILVWRLGLIDALVLSRLRAALGCQATASSVSITLAGDIVIENLQLRAPGVNGPAGLFLQTRKTTITPIWTSMLSSAPRIEKIAVKNSVLRILYDSAGALNVAALSLGAATSGALPPEVSLEACSIELGEFGPAWYTPLTTLQTHGVLARSSPGSTLYTVELFETSPPPASSLTPANNSPSRLRVTGEIDIRDLSTSLRLDDFNLARLNAVMAPSSLQSQWIRMGIAGRLSGAEFSYSKPAGVSATVHLQQVDLNIPLPAEPPADFEGELMGPFEDLLAMRGVTGAIRLNGAGLHADLAGSIEDLACRVSLDTRGVAIDAPLSVRIVADDFRLVDRPRLLPFAPRLVKRNLRRFSGPTALISGEINIDRGPPIGAIPGRISATGFLHFSQGTARFEKFTYPFQNMRGDIVFDDDKVEIRAITGVGPSGARVLATGVVQPPTEDAGVDVTIVVSDVPTDAVLYEALPPNKRKFYDALFAHTSFNALDAQAAFLSSRSRIEAATRRAEIDKAIELSRAAGAPDSDRADLRRRRDDIEQRLALPDFNLGGVAEIRVKVTREPGEHHEYLTDVRVNFPTAGILPEAFPYPVIAHDLSLHITDDNATAHSSALTGLTGFIGDLDARVDFRTIGHDDFDITISADSVPLDRHLIDALEQRESSNTHTTPTPPTPPATPAQSFDLTPSRILRDLALAGAVSFQARVTSRPSNPTQELQTEPPTDYTVVVAFSNLTAQPMRSDLALSQLTGDLTVTAQTIRLRDLHARIADAFLSADFAASGLDSDNPDAPPSMVAALELTDLDIAQPIERLVEAFSPDHARILSSLRATHAPSGRIDTSLTLGFANGRLEYRADLARPRSLAFNALGGRLAILDSSGDFSLASDALRCDNFLANLAYENQPAGRLALSGLWPLQNPTNQPEPTADDPPRPPDQMALELTDAHFDSPIVRAIADALEPAAASWLNSFNIRGAFDASGIARRSPSRGPYFTGALSPRSLGLTCEGGVCDFNTVLGRITFSPQGGRVESLEAHSLDWSFLADGSWSRDPSLTLDLRASIEAVGLPPGLAALLPPQLIAARDALNLRILGPLSVPSARFTITREPSADQPLLAINLDAHFTHADADLGLPIAAYDANLRLALLAPLAPTTPAPPTFNLDLTASQLLAAGLQTTDLTAHASSAQTPGVYLLHAAHAHSHGGDITLQGSLRSPSHAGPADYELDLRATRLDFASLLDELASSVPTAQPDSDPAINPTPPQPQITAPAPTPPETIAGSRGELSASFSLTGEVAASDSRRGRGALRIQGGEVLALPGLSGLLRLSNLQPPIDEPLDNASAILYLLRDSLVLQRAEVSSSSLMIVGEGTIALPSLDLDLRFNSKGVARGAIFSNLLRGIRDEIVTTAVTGPLRNPKSRLIQFPATRRMLAAIFRGEPKRKPPVVAPAPPSPSTSSN